MALFDVVDRFSRHEISGRLPDSPVLSHHPQFQQGATSGSSCDTSPGDGVEQDTHGSQGCGWGSTKIWASKSLFQTPESTTLSPRENFTPTEFARTSRA